MKLSFIENNHKSLCQNFFEYNDQYLSKELEQPSVQHNGPWFIQQRSNLFPDIKKKAKILVTPADESAFFKVKPPAKALNFYKN